MSTTSYSIVGLMSGTSLDGLDIALCEFELEQDRWRYRITEAETVSYPEDLSRLLRTVDLSGAEQLVASHVRYGRWLGGQVRDFLRERGRSADFIASHGHTIFHQPANGFTFQLGDGAALSVAAGLPVVCDFRMQDVARGGQGAPLVPVGDRLLFGEYSHCLNLGGIANISYDREGRRVAGDLCGCNLLLNPVAERKGLAFDRDGALARAGRVHPLLLTELNALTYYRRPLPKSLGREDLERDLEPIIQKYALSEEDLLATLSEHIAQMIGEGVRQSGVVSGNRLLLTGGGARNRRLVELIREKSGIAVELPEERIIDFKEALIFAFLGLLRWRGEVNVLASVTGADGDHSAGAVYR
jgi:anhydro-N-acetylmuramic acid kinase